MGRADGEVPNRGVDGSSRPRRACYPRGNFSVISSPHQWGHGCSLSLAFASGSLALEDPVRPAFGFALYDGFLSHLSRPLGPLDSFSRGCHPSQTAHLPLSQRILPGKSCNNLRAVFHWRLLQPPKRLGSIAPAYTLHRKPQLSNKLQ